MSVVEATSIVERLQHVRSQIDQACKRAGRSADSVRLIAVSKLQPVAAIREAYAAGQRDFGENYVQELVEKSQQLADLPDIRFHLIGHLQKNKAKYVVKVAHFVHTIDDAGVALELNKRMAERVKVSGPLPVLLQVNIAAEEQKSGCSEESLEALISSVSNCLNLRMVGLMTIGPLDQPAEQAKRCFARLRELSEKYRAVCGSELSMGMTHDLDVAIEEGATMVRIGTAIFGAR